MEFQVLGPLRVVDGGRDLTPARLKQRALLALLLLRREEVVPGSVLIEALWGEEPPGTARTALYGHVSALRKLLGANRIRTRPPGYVLHAAPDEIDLMRFESLLAEARQRAEPAERAARLGEALALWRAEPLADLRYEAFAQPEIARLEELRLGALEDRIDADLALGRHAELVAEVEPLVAEHAARERLRGQLMLALYRCGRQPDALHAFQRGRQALVEELGIEPGPALQQLERQILNQDPSLELAAPVAPPAAAAPPAPSAALDEERKVTTILFADVIGSTEPGERLDPERLRALLRAYVEAMSDVIASWGGTLEKYIGDAIVAVFGVPTVHEDDCERAIRAALEMLERLRELNRSFAQRYGITLAIRIGINTGEVIAPVGRAGGDQLVAGDVVNVAARLEQAAEPGTVLVGERTHALACRAFRFEQPLTLDLMGKSGAVSAFPVVGVLPAGERVSVTLQAPLVGRQRELGRLTGLLAEVVETSTPRLVLVYGPAGIGKSRLTLEFLDSAQQQGNIGVVTGRCLATGHGITYWALAEILRQTFGISLDDRATEAGEKLLAGARARLARLELTGEELERTVFALATTAGITLPDNPLARLEPRSVADELARAWPQFATALAREQPTIVVIEDLHWASEQVVEMLDRLISRSRGPLLIAATARPEFAEGREGFAAGREGVTTISLQSLTEPEGGALVDALIDSVELPSELRDGIVRAAEGNPFFLEEIVRRLIDTGAIVREGDRWRVEGAADFGTPDTVHRVLAARIDALPPEDKRVLQEAAVVGRRFWQEPLNRALGDVPVRAALLRLEDRGLVTALPGSSIGGQAEYQFKHALVRDVAYASLPKARRARSHADHAIWLEELAGERRAELQELIAAHYQAALTGEDADLAWADDPVGWATTRKRGFEALLAAGNALRHRFAIARAVELHEQALLLASGNPVERGRALAAIGDDHEAAYHGDDAFAAYRSALELLRHESNTEELRAHIFLMASRMAAVKWGGFRKKPTPPEMERFLDEGLELATDEAARNWLTVLKGNVGLRWLWSGLDDPIRVEDRVRSAQQAVEAAERIGLPDLLSQAYRTYGLLQSGLGRWDVTVDSARLDLALADRLERTEQAFCLFWNAVFLMEIAGEFAGNLPHAERAVEVARGLTPHEVMHGTYTLMNARYHLGRWAELEPVAAEHLGELAKEPGIGCPYVRGGPLFAALALAHRGELERAHELAATLEPDLEAPKLPESLLASYLVARGDAQAGRDLAEQIVGRRVYAEENVYEVLVLLDALVALADWDAVVTFLPRARCFVDAFALVAPASQRAEGLARAAAGKRDEAEELLRRALAGFARMGVVFEAARTMEELASVTSSGDAARLRAEALAAYERLGAAPHVDRVRSSLYSVR